MGWSLGSPYYEGDIWTIDMKLEEWEQILYNEYTYVYLFRIDTQFISRYGSLFEDEITDDSIYEIIKNSESISLRKIR